MRKSTKKAYNLHFYDFVAIFFYMVAMLKINSFEARGGSHEEYFVFPLLLLFCVNHPPHPVHICELRAEKAMSCMFFSLKSRKIKRKKEETSKVMYKQTTKIHYRTVHRP